MVYRSLLAPLFLPLLLLPSLLAATPLPPPSPRVSLPFDDDWRFHLGDPSDAASPAFDDSAWRSLSLPHDWSIEGDYREDAPSKGTGAYLPGGIGWYRKVIDAPPDWAGKRVRIEFDAASRNSTVYLNGQALGTRPYSHISFAYDLTPHLKPGRNVLAVRLDNSQVPSARWYLGSGIYAHVRLVVTDPLHVAQWGTYVTTPEITKERARVEVVTEVANAGNQPATLRLVSEVLDPAGKTIATVETGEPAAAGKTVPVRQTLDVRGPQLWSPDTPVLYTLVSRVYRGQDLADEYRTPFGIRSIRFDADTGFWLNGRNTKLLGFGMHYDAAGLCGAAIPDALLEHRLRQIKANGANAIRTGHTPFPPLFYDLCDRLGLMVVDEAFDGWRRKAPYDYGALHFAEWWKRDLGDMVRRDRNHPSVVLWSLGNETGERDVHGLSEFVRNIDPTRPTTGGQLLEGVDVSGFTGKAESPGVLEAFRKEHPKQPVLLIEGTHAYATRGFYRTLTWWRDPGNVDRRSPFPPYSPQEVFTTGGDPQYNSAYDNALVRLSCRQHTKRTKETPWIAGEFKWAAFDYLGEASFAGRHWPMRYGNPGILDSAGFPKDIYHFYQSQYSREPMVHLLPHWTHPQLEEGTKVPVVAYSNCDEVELFLNGNSLGRQKPRELLDFVWQVPYAPGEIKAVAYRGGKAVAETSHATASAPARLELTVDPMPASTAGSGPIMATVRVRDERGQFVPDADNRVDFRLVGPARQVGLENGNPTDTTPHHLSHRDTFNGLLRGLYQPTAAEGAIELHALALLGDRLFQESTTVALAPATLALRGSPAPGVFAYHYTTDGSEPTADSPRLEKPLTIRETTTVRVACLRDGKAFMRTESTFVKGPEPAWEDERFERPDAKPTEFPKGPRDKEIVGVWTERGRRLRFDADGTLVRFGPEGTETPVARWWYDFPDDRFENPGDVGRGELLWNDSGKRAPLKLRSTEGNELLLNAGEGRVRRLTREDK